MLLSRNHTSNSHVNYVSVILWKSWVLRHWQLWQLYNSEYKTEKCRHLALIGLLCFFVGEEVHTVSQKSEHFSSHLAEVEKHINDLIPDIAERLFSKWHKDSDKKFNAVSKLVLRQFPKDHKFPNEQIVFIKKARCHLSAFCL